MSQERYFLYLDGVQRGPYTVAQIGHMVNSGIVHPSAMFWCEGLEQWQPVTQLIVHKDEKKRRRISVSAWMLGFLGLLLVLFWMAGPTLREGWREQHQVERTALGAYWSARGVLRAHLGWFSALRFSDFNPSQVVFVDDGHAYVILEADVSGGDSAQRRGRWQVDLRYDKRLQVWMPDATDGPKASAKPEASVKPEPSELSAKPEGSTEPALPPTLSSKEAAAPSSEFGAESAGR
ncbi:MAG: DUF4339 domain-containing protein [Proteobacteria bacterium]|nr:DUF4339 domain-containing protein [Pseudomonadota bacterium]